MAMFAAPRTGDSHVAASRRRAIDKDKLLPVGGGATSKLQTVFSKLAKMLPQSTQQELGTISEKTTPPVLPEKTSKASPTATVEIAAVAHIEQLEHEDVATVLEHLGVENSLSIQKQLENIHKQGNDHLVLHSPREQYATDGDENDDNQVTVLMLPSSDRQPSDVDISHYKTLTAEERDEQKKNTKMLMERLEAELRMAKRTHLECGEVLVPHGLLDNVVQDMLELSELEPYGVRGAQINVNFEASQACHQLAVWEMDSESIATFQLTLTLKQEPPATWQNLMPSFVRNLTKGSGTIVISDKYRLSKRKLYRQKMKRDKLYVVEKRNGRLRIEHL